MPGAQYSKVARRVVSPLRERYYMIDLRVPWRVALFAVITDEGAATAVPGKDLVPDRLRDTLGPMKAGTFIFSFFSLPFVPMVFRSSPFFFEPDSISQASHCSLDTCRNAIRSPAPYLFTARMT
jgi:hypothetical protein